MTDFKESNPVNKLKLMNRAGALLCASSSFFCCAAIAHDVPKMPLTPQQRAERDKTKAQMQPIGRKQLTELPPNLPGPVLTSSTKFISGVIIQRADGGKTYQLNFNSEKSAKEIYDWYGQTLKNSGWKIKATETKKGTPGWMIGSKKAQLFVNVHFLQNAGSKKAAKGCNYTVTINQTKKAIEEGTKPT